MLYVWASWTLKPVTSHLLLKSTILPEVIRYDRALLIPQWGNSSILAAMPLLDNAVCISETYFTLLVFYNVAWHGIGCNLSPPLNYFADRQTELFGFCYIRAILVTIQVQCNAQAKHSRCICMS